MKRAILVFLKLPEPGRVKTRLAESVGIEAAARAYKKLACRVFEQIRGAEPDIVAVAYDPPTEVDQIKEWLAPWLAAFPGETWWIPQSEGDLGDRLESATGEVFQRGGEIQLAVVGTDCVTLLKPVFDSVWAALSEGSDVVFGPAADGGYYLMGMSAPQPGLFREIPWSTSQTLSASLSICEAENLNVELLETSQDVDTVDDWRRVEEEVSNRRCVFFDRDGVVNRSPGPGYVLNEDSFFLNEGVAEAIGWLKQRGWLAILVTSQKGVGKGLMTHRDLAVIHDGMQRDLAVRGAAFDGIYAYTGEAGGSHQPKPDPEMILSAAESFFVDLRQSWIVGDADRDIEMGRNAGLAGTIRIHGEKAIGVPAEHTLERVLDLKDLFEKIL